VEPGPGKSLIGAKKKKEKNWGEGSRTTLKGVGGKGQILFQQQFLRRLKI